MSYVPYSEKMKDPRWQRKRLEILQRDNWSCTECWEIEKPLHVHHRYYIPGREPWDYPPFCLITLCDECHAEKKDNAIRLWEKVAGALLVGNSTGALFSMALTNFSNEFFGGDLSRLFSALMYAMDKDEELPERLTALALQMDQEVRDLIKATEEQVESQTK